MNCITGENIADLYHRSAAVVDLACISHNLQVVREKAPGRKIIAMVKANAYGHGLVRVAEHLASEGVDYLGTAFVEEALELRRAGITIPIITSGPFSRFQIGLFIENNIDLTIASVDALQYIREAAEFYKKRVNIHLKVDTGMMRIGIRYTNARKLFAAALEGEKYLNLVSIFSHFANSDNQDLGFAQLQLERFLEATRFFAHEHRPSPLLQIANSAAILRMEESQLDMIRPGIMLYGYHPSPATESQASLQPALSLRAKIMYFKVVLAGNSVGYGRTWTAPQNCRVVTIPVGYGDGYPRALSNKGQVLLRGQRYPVRGSVCMDQTMIGIGAGEAYIGEEVQLIGRQGGEVITADDLAAQLGTISYEVLTNISARVPRIYVNEHRGRNNLSA
ncbi:MAG: alanine racemase [Candidatus Electrothrix sp. GW3-4]|uniref:alanine racemase n=1 Tax=Candidatus Electrothrix sp. GW3-4 TaxID=3126740 RepID=UPI0030D537EE